MKEKQVKNVHEGKGRLTRAAPKWGNSGRQRRKRDLVRGREQEKRELVEKRRMGHFLSG